MGRGVGFSECDGLGDGRLVSRGVGVGVDSATAEVVGLGEGMGFAAINAIPPPQDAKNTAALTIVAMSRSPRDLATRMAKGAVNKNPILATIKADPEAARRGRLGSDETLPLTPIRAAMTKGEAPENHQNESGNSKSTCSSCWHRDLRSYGAGLRCALRRPAGLC